MISSILKFFAGLLVAMGFLSSPILPMGGITPALTSATIDGQVKSIEYTDDNTGEGLIVKTTQRDFHSSGSFLLYFSVYNSTKNDQNVKLVFSFARDYVQQIWEQNGEETIQVPTVHPARPATASTSAKEAYTTYESVTKTKWNELPKESFKPTALARKDTKGMKSLEENTVLVKSGETKFFKANINYLPNGKEEFLIEALGTSEYGMLDPYVAGTLDQYLDKSQQQDYLSMGRISSNNPCQGQSFTPTKSGSVTAFRVDLKKVNSPTGNIHANIMTVENNLPGVELGGDSDVIDVSTLPASEGTWTEFQWSSNLASITSGTQYYFVMRMDTAHDTNFLYVYHNYSSAYAGGVLVGCNPGWYIYDANADEVFEEYYLAGGGAAGWSFIDIQ